MLPAADGRLTGMINPTVDGGSWRTSGDFSYPDFLLAGGEFEGVKGKKSKL